MILASDGNPACAAGPPGSTNVAGVAVLCRPTIRSDADSAFGRETFAKMSRVPRLPAPVAFGIWHRSVPCGVQSALSRSPTFDDPMYGTTANLPSSMTSDFSALDVTSSPSSVVSAIRVWSANTASTATSVLSPSNVKGLSENTTLRARGSNSMASPLLDAGDTVMPWNVFASSPTTLVGFSSTLTRVSPIVWPFAPVTVTYASPGNSPSTTLSPTIRATAGLGPLTSRLAAMVLVMSAVKRAPCACSSAKCADWCVANNAETCTLERWYIVRQSSRLYHPWTACKLSSSMCTDTGKTGAHTTNVTAASRLVCACVSRT